MEFDPDLNWTVSFGIIIGGGKKRGFTIAKINSLFQRGLMRNYVKSLLTSLQNLFKKIKPENMNFGLKKSQIL